MTGAEGRGIFVSYRRQKTGHLAGRLHDRLVARFGESQVFIDVDAIEPGVDFAEESSVRWRPAEVLLAIVGPAWLTATDEQRRRRPMIPTISSGSKLRPPWPAACGSSRSWSKARSCRPAGSAWGLAGLARRNALHIRLETFRSDAGAWSRRSSGRWRSPAQPQFPALPMLTALDQEALLVSWLRRAPVRRGIQRSGTWCIQCIATAR